MQIFDCLSLDRQIDAAPMQISTQRFIPRRFFGFSLRGRSSSTLSGFEMIIRRGLRVDAIKSTVVLCFSSIVLLFRTTSAWTDRIFRSRYSSKFYFSFFHGVFRGILFGISNSRSLRSRSRVPRRRRNDRLGFSMVDPVI